MDLEAWRADRDREMRARLEPLLTVLHRPGMHAQLPAEGLVGIWPPGVHPVVVDANVLRDDIRRYLRTGRDTILLTAANRSLRLFCARHVIDEVYEHAGRWSVDHGSVHDFHAAFEKRYLPLMRLVQPPPGLLTRGEQERLARLNEIDADDIPSVMLAMQLEAFYLSKDGPASDAAYAGQRSREDLDRYLDVLRAGSDEKQLQTTAELSLWTMTVVTRLLFEGVKAAARQPGAAALLLAGAALAATAWTPGSTCSLKRAGFDVLELASAVTRVMQLAADDFASACVPAPDDAELAAVSSRTRATRAAMWVLARQPLGDQSATRLRSLLLAVGADVGEDAVRAVLRDNPCFHLVARGRWQLGSTSAGAIVIERER